MASPHGPGQLRGIPYQQPLHPCAAYLKAPLPTDGNIFRFKVMLKINTHLAFRHVTHMPHGCFDFVIVPQKFADGCCLCRRLYDNQIFLSCFRSLFHRCFFFCCFLCFFFLPWLFLPFVSHLSFSMCSDIACLRYFFNIAGKL